jgi:hypothetical protein
MRCDIRLEDPKEAPSLEDSAYFSILAECQTGCPMKSPPTEEDAKKLLVEIAVTLWRHEKCSAIWKTQVS